MLNYIPAHDLHRVGNYFMYTPFDSESYVALYVRAENENIFVMRSDDMPVDEVEKLYSGKEVSPTYGCHLNQEKLISFLDKKTDNFSNFVDILVRNRKLVTSEEELLNFMLDLKALGFTSKKIIQVLNRILTEQFVELLNVWKNKPDILKSKFIKVMGT